METPTIAGMGYVSSTTTGNDFLANREVFRNLGAHVVGHALPPQAQVKEPQQMSARIVKVFIADSNENLPLEKRVLYEGEQKLTDLTDQELFFEVPIAEVLAKHNEVRKTTIDKKQSEKFGRDIMLEPVRIRDLKMVVVTIASF